jgi:type II secretory pathway pseudopilin PulG
VVGLVVGCLVIRLSGNKLLEIGCTSIPIMILFLILVPVFQQARDKAQEIKCRANLTQISRRLQGYAKRHKGKLPSSEKWTTPLRCPASKLPYVYEAGANGILVRESTNAHQSRMLILHDDGTIKAIKATSTPPTPPPTAQVVAR